MKTLPEEQLASKNWLKEHLLFAWRFIKAPQKVGTPFPCSSVVAKNILKYIPDKAEVPRHFAEFGPGTGAFTDYLALKLGPEDTLDLVEIDEEFCALLRQKFAGRPNIRVHNLSILDFHPEFKYDAIVTAIPPNAISSPQMLKDIYACYEKFIREGGTVSAVEYIGTASVKKGYLCLKNLVAKSNYQSFLDVLKVKDDFAKKYQIEVIDIWTNLLPARVTHYIPNGLQK